jgi:hypothetical protein
LHSFIFNKKTKGLLILPRLQDYGNKRVLSKTRKRNTVMKENDNYTRELLTFDLIKANLYGMFSISNFNHLSHSIILSGKTVLTKRIKKIC